MRTMKCTEGGWLSENAFARDEREMLRMVLFFGSKWLVMSREVANEGSPSRQAPSGASSWHERTCWDGNKAIRRQCGWGGHPAREA